MTGASHPTVFSVPAQYASIQAAIDAAPAGSVIEVAPGAPYREALCIRKAVAIMKAPGTTGSLVLEWEGTGPVLEFAPNISGHEVEATVEGINFRLKRPPGFGALGIDGGGVLLRSGSLRMVGCSVSNCDAHGILVLPGAHKLELQGCRVRSNAGCGILQMGGCCDMSAECQVSHNQEAGCCAQGATVEMRLEGCRLEHNGLCGMQVQHGAAGGLSKCSLQHNLVGASVLGHHSTLEIAASTISGSSLQGLTATAGATVVIAHESTIRLSQVVGIALTGGAQLRAHHGVLLQDNLVGIQICGHDQAVSGAFSACTLEHVTITGSRCGVQAETGTSATLHHTTVLSCGVGLQAAGIGTMLTCCGCGVTQCSSHGAEVMQEAFASFTDSTLSDNAGAGLNVRSLARGMLVTCSIDRNERGGACVSEAGSSMEVRAGSLQGNKAPGVVVRHKGTATVQGCYFASNAVGSLYCYFCDGSTLHQGENKEQNTESDTELLLHRRDVLELSQDKMDALVEEIRLQAVRYSEEQQAVAAYNEAFKQMVVEKEKERKAKAEAASKAKAAAAAHAEAKRVAKRQALEKAAAAAAKKLAFDQARLLKWKAKAKKEKEEAAKAAARAAIERQEAEEAMKRAAIERKQADEAKRAAERERRKAEVAMVAAAKERAEADEAEAKAAEARRLADEAARKGDRAAKQLLEAAELAEAAARKEKQEAEMAQAEATQGLADAEAAQAEADREMAEADQAEEEAAKEMAEANEAEEDAAREQAEADQAEAEEADAEAQEQEAQALIQAVEEERILAEQEATAEEEQAAIEDMEAEAEALIMAGEEERQVEALKQAHFGGLQDTTVRTGSQGIGADATQGAQEATLNTDTTPIG